MRATEIKAFFIAGSYSLRVLYAVAVESSGHKITHTAFFVHNYDCYCLLSKVSISDRRLLQRH